MQEPLWLITYTSGNTQEEHGKDEADVREFIARSYAHEGAVKSVELHPDYQ
jgi:hypothetical protein